MTIARAMARQGDCLHHSKTGVSSTRQRHVPRHVKKREKQIIKPLVDYLLEDYMAPVVTIVYIEKPVLVFFVRADNVGYARPDGSFTPGLSTLERVHAATFPTREAALQWARQQGFTVHA